MSPSSITFLVHQFVDTQVYFFRGLAVVIYVHTLSFNQGFVPGYMREDEGVPHTGALYTYMAEQGYFVMTYDQVGTGIRVLEDAPFYSRYPNSSKFARMVSDVHAAVDFVYCLSVAGHQNASCQTGEAHDATYPDKLAALPRTNMSSVTVVGYSVGGTVGLHAAALDSRITAVASLAGVAAWRQPMPESTGGLRRWYEWFGLLPRLGLFDKDPGRIPYELDEVLAAVAPRPLLLYTPQRDRDTVYQDVQELAQRAQRHYNSSGVAARFTWEAPNRINILTNTDILVFARWMKQQQH